MATTKARTVKLTDLAKIIDKAVEASAGKRLAGGTIIGRKLTPGVAERIDPKALARAVTKQVQAEFPDASLSPQVIFGDEFTTIGFIMKPRR